ncbi:MAG: peptide deformylase [Opitutae bacterium]|nr:peptide deformylase [Opitutae bacterium]MDG1132017.1 peptide deformylase [Opitutales bacterium]
MSLNICYFGNSVLRQKGRKIEKFDEQLTKLATDMLEIMHTSEGIGLAAQQIGKAIQFCVMEVPDYPDYPTACILDGKPLSSSLIMPLSLANPEVKTLPSDEYYYEEGCLSFPGINADVARPERIVVTYQDLDGVEHTLECDGLLARCIQHEVDHLNGVLFIDRMEKNTYAEIKKDVQTLKRQTIESSKKGSED